MVVRVFQTQSLKFHLFRFGVFNLQNLCKYSKWLINELEHFSSQKLWMRDILCVYIPGAMNPLQKQKQKQLAHKT